MQYQYCSRCNKSKPLNDDFFYKGSRYKNGYRTVCKECLKQQAKEHYENNIEEIRKKRLKRYYQ